jgi:hypothetical protein
MAATVLPSVLEEEEEDLEPTAEVALVGTYRLLLLFKC